MSNCIGLVSWGLCRYDPANPSPTYFSLGTAISALAFTLAVQNFLKPVYVFRLSIRHVTVGRLYSMVFTGTFLCFFAALVPRMAFLHRSIFGYAIFWEIIASSLFFAGYLTVAVSAAVPITVNKRNVVRFAKSAAKLLSEAKEADHLELLKDLKRSLPALVNISNFFQYRQKPSAFFMFQHRWAIENAQYAHSLLTILADHALCRTLVDLAPWEVSQIVYRISADKIYSDSIRPFLEQLGHQAIMSDEGMINREQRYHGFGAAPQLSVALFGNIFIITHFDTLHAYIPSDEITSDIFKRFNFASKMIFETLISNSRWDHNAAALSAKRFLETVSHRFRAIQQSPTSDYRFSMQAHTAVSNAIKSAYRLLASVSDRHYDRLFVDDAKHYHQSDLLEVFAEIVFDSLEGMANNFDGVSDPFWMVAREAMSQCFPSIGQKPDGMNPFQQRLALRLIDKLEDNMDGWYPAISRVLLATVGPYREESAQKNMTAFNILRDATYIQLQRLHDLAQTRSDKVQDKLPSIVRYDVERDTLTHTYSGGGESITELNTLKIATVSLVDPSIRRRLSQEERDYIKRDVF